ncbi:MAG: cache domain-containing protein, partial [Acidobacteria bacterium]|nr:cache domain-containing protein [Acidobacteriota bacterium]
MGIRPKIFLIYLALGVVPVLVLIYVSNLNSVDVVEAMLRDDLERDAAAIARDVEARQREQEASLVALARSTSLRDYVQQGGKQQPGTPAQASLLLSEGVTPDASAVDTVPGDVRADVSAFIKNKYYASVTCLSVGRQVLFRVEPDVHLTENSSPRYQTRDFLSNGNADERVWSVAERVPLRAPLAREPRGMIVRYTIPIFTAEEGASAQRGALVADMKVDALFSESAGSLIEPAGTGGRTADVALPPRIIVALDSKGTIIYHSNDALRYQPVSSAMPSFKVVADRMLQASDDGGGGWAFYDSTGSRWLAVYRRL